MAQRFVDQSRSNMQSASSTGSRPTHLLLFAEASIYKLVDSGFHVGACCFSHYVGSETLLVMTYRVLAIIHLAFDIRLSGGRAILVDRSRRGRTSAA